MTIPVIPDIYRMKHLLFATSLLVASFSFGQVVNTGQFPYSKDIGNPKKAGSSLYDASSKSYTLKGAGYNIWFNRDEFHFLYNRLKGDFVLTADFKFVDTGGNAHRKVGWMVRESDHESARSMNAVQHGDGLVVMQWRGKHGENMRDPEDEIFFKTKKVFQTLQLERNGDTYTMRVGDDESSLELVGSHELKMPATVLAGLFICSHDENRIEEIQVSNVRLSIK